MKPADLGHKMEIYFSLKLEFVGLCPTPRKALLRKGP